MWGLITGSIPPWVMVVWALMWAIYMGVIVAVWVEHQEGEL